MSAPINKVKQGLFSERETVSEAVEYMQSLIESLPKKHRAAAYTATYVLVNTIAKTAHIKDGEIHVK